jgi:hypothetical protein
MHPANKTETQENVSEYESFSVQQTPLKRSFPTTVKDAPLPKVTASEIQSSYSNSSSIDPNSSSENDPDLTARLAQLLASALSRADETIKKKIFEVLDPLKKQTISTPDPVGPTSTSLSTSIGTSVPSTTTTVLLSPISAPTITTSVPSITASVPLSSSNIPIRAPSFHSFQEKVNISKSLPVTPTKKFAVDPVKNNMSSFGSQLTESDLSRVSTGTRASTGTIPSPSSRTGSLDPQICSPSTLAVTSGDGIVIESSDDEDSLEGRTRQLEHDTSVNVNKKNKGKTNTAKLFFNYINFFFIE